MSAFLMIAIFYRFFDSIPTRFRVTMDAHVVLFPWHG